MSPRLRKLALTAHVGSSVGWLGAVAAFLVLAIAGLTTDDPEVAGGVYIATDLLTWFVLVPLALASLLTGVVQSLGSPWGLFRHYWVLAKLILTAVATVVLLLQTGGIADLGAQAAEGTLAVGQGGNARASLVLHAAGGFVVLVLTTVLAIYKPPGRTRYGQRKSDDPRSGILISRSARAQ